MQAIFTRCRDVSLLLVLLAASVAMPSFAGEPPPSAVRKTVLIINEVGDANPAISRVSRELLLRLSQDHNHQVEFFSESLETPAFLNEAAELKTEKDLIEKYRDRKVDVIVAVGPNPIVFLSHFADTFLPGVPVVFCGSDQNQAGNPKLTSRFTGSWMTFEPAKTIDAALKLVPETQHVFVVGGSSAFDKMNEAVAEASLNSYPARLDISYWTDLTMSNLLDRLRHLPPRAIVLYISLFRDAAGNRFVNATTALPLVSDAANAPVFGVSDTYIGRGAVGGYVVTYPEQGRIAADIVSELFQGKKAHEIPIRISPGSYMFDFAQMKRWGLSKRNLPSGSIVLFGEQSLWDRIKWPLLLSLLWTLGLGSLTLYLLHNRRQLRVARDEKARLTGMLIHAEEEERKRLASELHDDFSQRLVVLSLQLEAEAQNLPELSKQRLHAIVDYAGELGSDLHTLSHRLHSSTLERLGLVPGINAFCDEFSAQHHIPVTFSQENVPEFVPSDVALCLFRIVQESLRNVKKHSGASRAHVDLDSIDGCLHLSIVDNGIGFDTDDRENKQGLGLLSMAERARLIGARFRVSSAQTRGTRIDVWTSVPSAGGAQQKCSSSDQAVEESRFHAIRSSQGAA